MRHVTIVGIFTVMLTLITGLVFAENISEYSKGIHYQHVLSATSGSLKGDTLTLNGVTNVIYFSERPERIVGHTRLSAFIDHWDKGKDSFKSDPPNAYLTVLDENATQHAVLMLSGPKQENGNLYFKASKLEGNVPERFKTSTLFIDCMFK